MYAVGGLSGSASSSPSSSNASFFTKKVSPITSSEMNLLYPTKCQNDYSSSGVIPQKLKCFANDDTFLNEDKNLKRIRENSLEVNEELKTKKNEDGTLRSFNFDEENYKDDDIIDCENGSSKKAPVNSLFQDVSKSGMCLVNATPEKVCSCIQSQVSKGNQKAIGKKEIDDISHKLRSMMQVKTLLGATSKQVSIFTKIHYYLEHGTKEQKKKLLSSNEVQWCLPGISKRKLKASSCKKSTINNVSNTLKEIARDCNRNSNSRSLCKPLKTFSEMSDISTKELENASRPLLTIVDSNIEQALKKLKDSSEYAEIVKSKPKDLQKELLRFIENEKETVHLLNAFSNEGFEKMSNIDFVKRVDTYEKERLREDFTSKQRDANLLLNNSTPAPMGAITKEHLPYYEHAMALSSYILRSPIIGKEYREMVEGSEDEGISEFLEKMILEQDLGEMSFSDYVFSKEDEGIEELISTCGEIGKDFSRVCGEIETFDKISIDDFYNKDGNPMLTGLEDLINVDSSGEMGIKTAQYYCVAFSQALERGKDPLSVSDLIYDDDKMKNITSNSNSYMRKNGLLNPDTELVQVGSVQPQNTKLSAATKAQVTPEQNSSAPKMATPDYQNTNYQNQSLVPLYDGMVKKEAISAREEDNSLRQDDGRDALAQEIADLKAQLKSANSTQESTPSVEGNERVDSLLAQIKRLEDKMAKSREIASDDDSSEGNKQTKQVGSSRTSPSRSNSSRVSRASSSPGSGVINESVASSSGSSGVSSLSAPSANSSASSSGESSFSRSASTNGKTQSSALSFSRSDIGKDSIVIGQDGDLFQALLNSKGEPVFQEVEKGVFYKYEPILGEDGKVVIKDGKPLFKKVLVKDKERAIASERKKKTIAAPKKSRKIYRLDEMNRQIDEANQ
ncbi:hypothetical protein HBN50_09525 [Halobacteriovorax sp. GB3]|uniref:hypothetical protein n=1 Tax=Halobacteriovorax sp. GB3 TaxID=2719615 RepID=UPI00235FA00B|nr:hypothetical protein [Halobacteriovorax sp. GB3]MDD0853337.1 hypothetical protein [Halobacteriovorax sp. GB3]